MFPGIRATRYKNVIQGGRLRLKNPRLAGGKDVVNVVGHGIGNQIALNVIEGRACGRSRLPNDRIAHPVPGESVIVRTLHMYQAAVPRIVIGEINLRSIGRDPVPVRFGRVHKMCAATAEAEACARPHGQNNMATNWPQQLKPRAWRSALCCWTAASNSLAKTTATTD